MSDEAAPTSPVDPYRRPTPAGLPRPGEAVGRYRLVRELARGGMGAVFVAQDPAGREVALKLLLPDERGGQPDAELVARFQREGLAAARLRHPHVVAVHELGRDARGHPFLVMDLVPGESLARRLERGPLEERTAAELARQVALALIHLHQHGVVHRDLKPANVLVTPDGRAVVTDFGLARLEDQSRQLTETGTLLGTPAFMAPEQAGGEEVSPATDVYALGATLYALLVGEPPFQGPPVQLLHALLTRPPVPPARRRPGLSPALEAVCLRCLEKEPRDRYATAAEVAAELGRFLAREPVQAGEPRRRRRRRRALALTGAVAIVAGLGGLAALLQPKTVPGRPAGHHPERDRLERALEELAQGRPLEAHATLERALALAGPAGDDRLLELLARVERDEAPALVARLGPAAAFGLGARWWKLGRLEVVAALGSAVVAVEPGDPGARRIRAELARLAGRREEALAELAAVAPEALGDRQLLLQRAELELRPQSFDEDRTWAIDDPALPPSPVLDLMRGYWSLLRGDPDAAARAVAGVAAQDRNLGLAAEITWVLARLHDTDHDHHLLERAPTLPPWPVEARRACTLPWPQEPPPALRVAPEDREAAGDYLKRYADHLRALTTGAGKADPLPRLLEALRAAGG